MAGVLRYLGLHQAGGSHSHLSRRAKQFEIDTSHFLGQYQGLGGGLNKLEWHEVLVIRPEKSQRQGAKILRRAMTESGVEYVCNQCGQLPEWNNKKLVLDVDHMNGVPWDDRRENLQFVCPNCHSQYTNNRG